jgi:hypothetical protein
VVPRRGRVGSIWVDLVEHGLSVHILDRMTTQAAGTEPHLSERIGGAKQPGPIPRRLGVNCTQADMQDTHSIYGEGLTGFASFGASPATDNTWPIRTTPAERREGRSTGRISTRPASAPRQDDLRPRPPNL